MAIENDLTEICFLGGFLGNWEWEGHVFSTINKNLSSLSSSPFPPKKRKRKRAKSSSLLSFPREGLQSPFSTEKDVASALSSPSFCVFSTFPPRRPFPRNAEEIAERDLFGRSMLSRSPKQLEIFNEQIGCLIPKEMWRRVLSAIESGIHRRRGKGGSSIRGRKRKDSVDWSLVRRRISSTLFPLQYTVERRCLREANW